MSHIFISYSHKDIEQATLVHKALEKANYKVWRDIHITDERWTKGVSTALSNAIITLILLSRNSAISERVIEEIEYCKRNHIPTIALALNGFEFDGIKGTEDDEGDLVMGTIQIWKSLEEVLETLPKRGIHPDIPNGVYMLGEPEKEYAVGDYYDVDGIRGIVFETNECGTHGKIISLNEDVEIHWADIYRCYCTRDEKIQEKIEKRIGATSYNDGQDNNRKFIDEYAQDLIPKNLLPALSCCVNMQGGWYLPAIGELNSLLKHTTRTIINKTLHKHNADELMPNTVYWSSTEGDYGYLKSFELDKHGRIAKVELNKFGGVANIRYIRKF